MITRNRKKVLLDLFKQMNVHRNAAMMLVQSKEKGNYVPLLHYCNNVISDSKRKLQGQSWKSSFREMYIFMDKEKQIRYLRNQYSQHGEDWRLS